MTLWFQNIIFCVCLFCFGGCHFTSITSYYSKITLQKYLPWFSGKMNNVSRCFWWLKYECRHFSFQRRENGILKVLKLILNKCVNRICVKPLNSLHCRRHHVYITTSTECDDFKFLPRVEKGKCYRSCRIMLYQIVNLTIHVKLHEFILIWIENLVSILKSVSYLTIFQ